MRHVDTLGCHSSLDRAVNVYGEVESLDPAREVLCPGCLVGCATLAESSDDVEVLGAVDVGDVLDRAPIPVSAAPLGFVVAPGAVVVGRPPSPVVSDPVSDVSLVIVSPTPTRPGWPDVSTPPTPV
jgi:hypothetical protein